MSRKHQAKAEPSPPPDFEQSPNGDQIDWATVELLQNWRRQDATENPEEIRAAERELAEFKKAMNESRTLAGQPVVYP